MEEIFKAEKVVKKFINTVALDQVSVSIPRGSIYGLLGPNGAGKTTLIRIINQITAPDEGSLIFNSEKLRPEHISRIGYLPEERGLYKKMKVGEQALYLAQLKGLSKKEAMSRLKKWFGKFEILDWWNKKVEELSKGMQQKVQFIVTILHEPELLIFDEPFSGFDPINADMLKKEILAIRDEGATIIFSTHNMRSVEELCDHITLIDKGRTLIEGDIREIRNRYRSDTFEVGFQGEQDKLKQSLNNHYQLLETSSEGDLHMARIKLLHHTTENELLSLLIPSLHIISFNEVYPSMNDIFIKVVKEN
ncbi:MAG: ATP-binding cassette domain-containing protein [Bacteroidales bacterium]|nr:ATP-binding cassette domain-containing protein [Bacteroidales bacterium]